MPKPKELEFTLLRDEEGHPIKAEYKFGKRQADDLPLLNFLVELGKSEKRLDLLEVDKIKSIKHPDVILEIDRDEASFITNMSLTIHNREPDGSPIIEFITILQLLFGHELSTEQLQPKDEEV